MILSLAVCGSLACLSWLLCLDLHFYGLPKESIFWGVLLESVSVCFRIYFRVSLSYGWHWQEQFWGGRLLLLGASLSPLLSFAAFFGCFVLERLCFARYFSVWFCFLGFLLFVAYVLILNCILLSSFALSIMLLFKKKNPNLLQTNLGSIQNLA